MPPQPGSAPSGGGAAAAPPATPIDTATGGDFVGPATLPVQRSGERPLVGDAGRHAPTPSSDGADAEPAGSEPGEGLPLAVGTGIDGAAVAHEGAPAGDPAAGERADPASADAPTASAALATGPLSADYGGAAPPPQPASADAPPAPAARSVPLVVARSLRGAAPLRPGAGAPAAPPSATPGRTAAPAGAAFVPGSAAAGALPAAQAPEAPSPGSAASGWAVAQRSPVEEGGPRPGLDAPAGRTPLPVARAAAPGPPGPAAGRAWEPVTVSRLADGGGSVPPPPARVLGWSAGSGFAAQSASEPAVVQRAAVIDEVATQVDASPGAGATGGGTGGAGAGGAGQDYEEIADRVYDRIRSRFATELLLDRERMGLLIDG
jgi:hypothetical protein